VDDQSGAYVGSLANKPKFYGDTIAEVIGSNIYVGSWNDDRARTPSSSYFWLIFGSASNYGSNAGIFSSGAERGDVVFEYSHRTILSGY
jgi:hypothetical protein